MWDHIHLTISNRNDTLLLMFNFRFRLIVLCLFFKEDFVFVRLNCFHSDFFHFFHVWKKIRQTTCCVTAILRTEKVIWSISYVPLFLGQRVARHRIFYIKSISLMQLLAVYVYISISSP